MTGDDGSLRPPYFHPAALRCKGDFMDSGLGDPMGFVNTDNGTLKASDFDNIYVIGDATNVPTSKSGAVAHYESDIVVENILLEIEGQAAKTRL